MCWRALVVIHFTDHSLHEVVGTTTHPVHFQMLYLEFWKMSHWLFCLKMQVPFNCEKLKTIVAL